MSHDVAFSFLYLSLHDTLIDRSLTQDGGFMTWDRRRLTLNSVTIFTVIS